MRYSIIEPVSTEFEPIVLTITMETKKECIELFRALDNHQALLRREQKDEKFGTALMYLTNKLGKVANHIYST
jgi:hypothetical protein